MALKRCEQCGEALPLLARVGTRFCPGSRCRVAAHRASAPAELRERPRWVRFSATKVPLTVLGAAADVTDRATWATHEAAVRSRAGAGVGFVLNGDGIVCLDLDHCLDGGVLASWAAAVLDRVPATYVEVSPSGTGLHIWGTGSVPRGRRVRVGGGVVECYGTGRYITVTGRRYGRPARFGDLSGVLTELLG